jgi:hypothetical protein
MHGSVPDSLLLIVVMNDTSDVGGMLHSHREGNEFRQRMRAATPGLSIRNCERIVKRPNSPFRHFLTMTVCTDNGQDSLVAGLRRSGLFKCVSVQEPSDTTIAFGGFEYTTGRNGIADPAMKYLIHDMDMNHADRDMSFAEAWEFTTGNDSTHVALIGNGAGGGSVYDTISEFGGRVYSHHPGRVEGRYYESMRTSVGDATPDNTHFSTCINRLVAVHNDRAPDFDPSDWGDQRDGDVGVAPEVYVHARYPAPTFIGGTEYMHPGVITQMDSCLVVGARFLGISVSYCQWNEFEELREAAEILYDNGTMIVSAGGKTAGRAVPGKVYIPGYKNLTVSITDGNWMAYWGVFDDSIDVCATDEYCSFAASSVIGAMCLIADIHPEWNLDQLREKLLNSTDPLADTLWSPDSTQSLLGKGNINAYKAIATRVGGGSGFPSDTLGGPLYCSDTLLIDTNEELTIMPRTLANGVHRTHLRFYTRPFSNDTTEQYSCILVKGKLNIIGEDTNRVLLSSLKRTHFDPCTRQYQGFWGGIKVLPGGKMRMENVLMENVLDGVTIESADTVILRNVEIMNTRGAAIVINPHNEGNVSISKTVIDNPAINIFNSPVPLGHVCGIRIMSGSPVIDSCEIRRMGNGIFVHRYRPFTDPLIRAIIRNTTIDSCAHSGIFLGRNPASLIYDNDIGHCSHGGITMYECPEHRPIMLHVYDNLIRNCGHSQETGGIVVTQSAWIPRANRIEDCYTGIAVIDHGFIGHDTTCNFGETGYVCQAKIEADGNLYGVVAKRHSFGILGDYDGNYHSYTSTGNSFNFVPGTGIKHAATDGNSILLLECNLWDPPLNPQYYLDPSLFTFFPIDLVFATFPSISVYPYYQICGLGGSPNSLDSLVRQCRDHARNGDADSTRDLLAGILYLPERSINEIGLLLANLLNITSANDSLRLTIAGLLQEILQEREEMEDAFRSNVLNTLGELYLLSGRYWLADTAFTQSIDLSEDEEAANITRMRLMTMFIADTLSEGRASTLLQEIQGSECQAHIKNSAYVVYNLYGRAESIEKRTSTHPELKASRSAGITDCISLEVYPNPTNDNAFVMIRVRSNGSYKVGVASSSGMTLISKQVEVSREIPYTVELTTRTLPVGSYRIFVTDGDCVATLGFVKLAR